MFYPCIHELCQSVCGPAVTKKRGGKRYWLVHRVLHVFLPTVRGGGGTHPLGNSAGPAGFFFGGGGGYLCWLVHRILHVFLQTAEPVELPLSLPMHKLCGSRNLHS